MRRRRWFRFLVSAGTLFSQRRVFGLSAEAAFWATFTLPWLVLGLASATAGVASWFGDDVTDQVRQTVLNAASRVLTQESIDTALEPVLDAALTGSAGLTVVGLVAALWSGSRIFATFVEGSQVLNGRPPGGYVRTRGTALAIYALGLLGIAFVVGSIVLIPAAWAGLVGIAPGAGDLVLLVAGLPLLVVAMATLMFLADPNRTGWRNELPGGALSVLVWVAGSWGLSLYLRWVFQAESFYGAVAAPIAIMLWVLVSVLAVFVGMTCNAALRLARHGRFLVPSDPAPYVDVSLLHASDDDDSSPKTVT